MRTPAVARALLLAFAILSLAAGAPLWATPSAVPANDSARRAVLELRGVALVTSKAEPNVGAPTAFAFDYLLLPAEDQRLMFGAVVERRDEKDAWVEIPQEELAIEMQRFPPRGETERSGARMLVTPRTGLPAGPYRVHVSAALPADSAAAAISKTFLVQVLPPAEATENAGELPPVIFDKKFPVRFESWEAASDTVGGRFPGGQSLGFHGAWTDPVTGFVYLRHRWYDPRTGQFLSPDPMGPVDSPNLYAFARHRPNTFTDPLGRQAQDVMAEERDFEDSIAHLPPALQQAERAARRQGEAQAMSMTAGFLPYLGEAHDASQVLFGRDFITGETLTPGEQALVAGAMAAPFVGGKVVRVVADTPLGRWAGDMAAGAGQWLGSKWDDFRLRIDPSSVNALAPEADEAFFWSGHTGGIGGEVVAREVASGRGGRTLEMVMADRGVQLPPWNGSDPAVVAAWDAAAKAYAENASGTVRVVLGQQVRPDSTWSRVEYPALLANKRVDRIIAIDPATGAERVIHSGASNGAN